MTDCDRIEFVSSCADLQLYYPQCVQGQIYKRYWMVASNIFYLFPALLVLVVNPKPLQVSEMVASMCFVLVFVSSSLYHTCDTENSSTLYCGDYWCAAPNHNMHMMDYIAAGWSIHATLLLGWTPSSTRRLLYCFAVAVALPFGALLLEPYGYAFYYYMSCIVLADLHTRAQSTSKRYRMMAKKRLVRAPVTFMDWLQQHWTLNPAGGWQIWLPLTIAFTGMAFLVDSLYQTSVPYYERHSTWHACTAVAGVTAVMMFKRGETTTTVSKPNSDSLLPLLQQQQQTSLLMPNGVDDYL